MELFDIYKEGKKKIKGKIFNILLITLLFFLTFSGLSGLVFAVDLFFPDYMNLTSIISYIFIIPLITGLDITMLQIYRGERVQLFDFIVNTYKYFIKTWKAYGLFLLMVVPLVAIAALIENYSLRFIGSYWTYLFQLIEIIALCLSFFLFFRYSQINYLLYDYPFESTINILKLSKKAMVGRKSQYLLSIILLMMCGFMVSYASTFFLVLPFALLYVPAVLVVCVFLIFCYFSFFRIAFYEDAKSINLK